MASDNRVYAEPQLVTDSPGFKAFAEIGLPSKLCWSRHHTAPTYCFEFAGLSTKDAARDGPSNLRPVGVFSCSLGSLGKPICLKSICLDRRSGALWIVPDETARGVATEPQFLNGGVELLEQCFAEYLRLMPLFPYPSRDTESEVAAWMGFQDFVLTLDPEIGMHQTSFWLSQLGDRLEGCGVL